MINRIWLRLCIALTVLVVGCAGEPQKRDAVIAVNQAFQKEYESILAERGLRTYRVRRGDVYVALHAALGKLGMRVVDQDPELGTLNVNASAPRPLSAAEWRQAGDADLPKLRAIARPHIGLLAEMINFEPDGLEIVIHATMIEIAGETEVSLTTRMREIAPAKSGMPRREYPPPTATRMALDKIWNQVEQELRAARRLP